MLTPSPHEQLIYDNDITSASNVTLADGSSASANTFSGVELETAMSLTAKIDGDKIYAYINDGSAPNDGGCCASTLRAYDQDGSYHDIDLSFIASDIFPDSDYAYATHTFDIFEGVAYFMVQYEER